MRNLRADLEYVTNPPSGDLEYWRKRSIAMPNIAKHAIERAIEAEALARELVGLLQMMHRAVITLLDGEDVPPEFVDHITLGASEAIRKAEEVLGDEEGL